MLYRIDYEHFLLHFIDYFTRKELISIKYIIISANVFNTDKMPMVSKAICFYPSNELTSNYQRNNDIELFNKDYFKELDSTNYLLYEYLIEPLTNHEPIIIICRTKENFIIDIFCQYMLEKYKIDCIDLNQLFINGKINSIEYNHNELKETAKNIKTEHAKNWFNTCKHTIDGRKQLVNTINDKLKKKIIKELGYDVKKINKSQYNEILNNDWVNDI